MDVILACRTKLDIIDLLLKDDSKENSPSRLYSLQGPVIGFPLVAFLREKVQTET